MRLLLAFTAMLAACAGAEEGEAPQSEQSAPQAASQSPEPVSKPAPRGARKTVACTDAEEEIFSCKVRNGKRIAVCAGDGGDAQYRFGKDAPELVLEGGEWSSTPYSGGGEAQIAFTRGSIRYVVFSRMIRTNFTAGEPNNPIFSDGVLVLDGEKVIGMQVCDDPDVMPVQYFAAEAAFPRAKELFTWETDRADPNYPPE